MSDQNNDNVEVSYRLANAGPFYLNDDTQFYIATIEPPFEDDADYLVTMGFANYGQPELYMPVSSSNGVANVMLLELARRHITCDLKTGTTASEQIRNLQGDLVRYEIAALSRTQVLNIAQRLESVSAGIVNYDMSSVYDYGILQVFCPDRFNKLPGEKDYEGVDQSVKTVTLQ